MTRTRPLRLAKGRWRQKLDIISSAFRGIRTNCRKKACARCDCIVQPAAPGRPIERGFASPALLARIPVSRYTEHQPLYR
jgi:transposase